MLVTISDRRISIDDGNGDIAHYEADVVNGNDYYPFGMGMPGRKYAGSDLYRYGFNGQEKSTEIDPNGNSMTAEFWQYDARLGRRWNVDPKPNISSSVYATLENNPVQTLDPLGDTVRPGTAVRDMKFFEKSLQKSGYPFPSLGLTSFLPENDAGDAIVGVFSGSAEFTMATAKGTYQLVTNPKETFRNLFDPAKTIPWLMKPEDIHAQMQPYLNDVKNYGNTYANTKFFARFALEVSSTLAPLPKPKFSLRPNRNVVYRFDTRSPAEIIKADGFQSWGIDMRLERHATGKSILDGTSGYVSTSFSKGAALKLAKGKDGYLYTLVKPIAGKDVNKILGKDSPFPWEKEWAVPLEIPAINIKSVKKLNP